MIWQLSSQPALPQAAPAGGNDGEVTITAEITDTGDRPAAEFTIEGPDHGAFGADTTVFTVAWDRPDGFHINDAPPVEVEIQFEPADGSNLDFPLNNPVTEVVNRQLPLIEIPWQTSKDEQGQEVFTRGTVLIHYDLEPQIITVARTELPSVRRRLTFGIREIVILTVPGYLDEDIEWSLGEGGEGHISTWEAARSYVARDTAGTDQLIADLSDGPTLEQDIHTIHPTGVQIHRRDPPDQPDVHHDIPSGQITSTVLVDVEYLNRMVNFGRLDMFESAAESDIDGYCKDNSDFYLNQPHDQNGPHPMRFMDEMHPFGPRFGNYLDYNPPDGGDKLRMPTHGRPYTGYGIWTWHNRWMYQAGQSDILEIDDPVTPQSMVIETQQVGPDLEVRYRIEKGGVIAVDRTLINP